MYIAFAKSKSSVKGVYKEHRPNPIVQMGLFMDSLGLPMCYKLFEGNTNNCLTLKLMVQELQKNYNVGKVNVDEKQVVFWSADYAKCAKAERQPAIDKAKDLIGNVQKYNKKNCVGASKYVKHLVFDKNTGEIIEAKSQLFFTTKLRILH